MFNHVMLDLETLSSHNNAAILSIGAVRMDLEKFELGEEFYVSITPSTCTAGGLLHIDAETVAWWSQQTPEAQQVLKDSKSLPLMVALQGFAFYLGKETVDGVWGHGSTFDNVILRTAYEIVGLGRPWPYRADLCFRTMRKLFHMPKPEEGIAHNALDDARRQAHSLIDCLSRLHRVVGPADWNEKKS